MTGIVVQLCLLGARKLRGPRNKRPFVGNGRMEENTEGLLFTALFAGGDCWSSSWSASERRPPVSCFELNLGPGQQQDWVPRLTGLPGCAQVIKVAVVSKRESHLQRNADSPIPVVPGIPKCGLLADPAAFRIRSFTTLGRGHPPLQAFSFMDGSAGDFCRLLH